MVIHYAYNPKEPIWGPTGNAARRQGVLLNTAVEGAQLHRAFSGARSDARWRGFRRRVARRRTTTLESLESQAVSRKAQRRKRQELNRSMDPVVVV